jgi:hypothetical protein
MDVRECWMIDDEPTLSTGMNNAERPDYGPTAKRLTTCSNDKTKKIMRRRENNTPPLKVGDV